MSVDSTQTTMKTQNCFHIRLWLWTKKTPALGSASAGVMNKKFSLNHPTTQDQRSQPAQACQRERGRFRNRHGQRQVVDVHGGRIGSGAAVVELEDQLKCPTRHKH